MRTAPPCPTPRWWSGFRGHPASQRGYGAAHQRKRLQVKQLVDRGAMRCCRCGQPIRPNQPWHLDHSDAPGSHQRGEYAGVSHSWCNISARNQRIAALARQAQGLGEATPEKPPTGRWVKADW